MPSSCSWRTGGPHVAPSGRIQVLSQLVEDHQPGSVEQGEHQKQPLPFPAAQRAERRPAPTGQPELLKQLAAVTGAAGAEQLHRLGHPQPVRQRRVLQLAAHHRPQRLGLRSRVVAEHPDGPGVRLAQSLDAFDRRGLARPVGADQPDDLARRDVEVQPVHHHGVAVRLAQTSRGHYLRFVHAPIVPPAPTLARQPPARTPPLPQGGQRQLRPGLAARSGCARTLLQRRCRCTLAAGSCRSRARRSVV